MSTPLFLTHHAPVGAWASLTFGQPGRGVSIDHERLGVGDDADLLVSVCRENRIKTLPFVGNQAAHKGHDFIAPEAITRTLTPCVDEYAVASEGLTLRVYTPHGTLPNPRRSGNLQYATVPAILIEVEIDNSASDSPARGFLGLNYHGSERLRPADWSSKVLCGVGLGSRWILGAHAAKEDVYTLRDVSVEKHLIAGQPFIHNVGNSGGIAFNVPARSKKTLTATFAFHHPGSVTQGLDSRYLYTTYFPKIEVAANFLLQNAQRVREAASNFDQRCNSGCSDPRKIELFAQALRAYEANTQITEAEGNVYFSVIDGHFGWRNNLNLAVDNLPWELTRNPWVVRNVFDLCTSQYSYQDQVCFPESGEPSAWHDGGMSLAHDMGSHSAYSPNTTSGYEQSNVQGRYSYMTTEQVLNGIYLMTSYALTADDAPWSRTRLPFARELLMSLENRDHWEPEKRDGILKGRSSRCGDIGEEITTFVDLDPSLGDARGSLYITLKAFAANLMLTTYFQSHNDLHSADYSYAFAQKSAQSIVAAFDQAAGLLPANLLKPDTSASAPRVLAIFDALALPTYLGLTSTMSEYFPELYGVLKQHAETCLNACIDPATGALRLTSSSSTVFPSKLISVLFVLERLFQVDIETRCPSAWNELLHASQKSSAAGSIADQIDVSQRKAVGAAGSPRLVTAALFVRPTTG